MGENLIEPDLGNDMRRFVWLRDCEVEHVGPLGDCADPCSPSIIPR